MSTPPPSDRAALGRERLAARARRIGLIRRRVVAAVLATFVLAWGAIAWDGSMGTTTTAQVTTGTTSSTASGDTTASGDSAASDDSASSANDSSTSSAPSMTTGQS
jgi:cytoskeletal protein RodZ